MNLLSPRLKRRANYGRNGRGEDNDVNVDNNNNNNGVPRSTLATATIRRESDLANTDVPGGRGALNRPATKVTNMYLSLTFEQDTLGKAAADKDNGVEAQPGDNDHQDNYDNSDNVDDGDGGVFAGSAVGSQSGVQLICRQ